MSKYSNLNCFWYIKNISQILHFINKSHIYNIQTHDYDDFFNSIPLEGLCNLLIEICDKNCFKEELNILKTFFNLTSGNLYFE